MAKWLFFIIGAGGIGTILFCPAAALPTWVPAVAAAISLLLLAIGDKLPWCGFLGGKSSRIELREQHLRAVMTGARCLVFELNAEAQPNWQQQPKTFAIDWDLVELELDAEVAQSVLPIDLPAGTPYTLGEMFKRRHAEDEIRAKSIFRNAVTQKLPMYSSEYRCLNRHGQYQWLSEKMYIQEIDDRHWHIVVAIQDISEQRQVQEGLRDIMRRAGCIIFHGTLRTGEDPADVKLHQWDMQIADEAAAQQVLALDVLEGETYIIPWRKSRFPEDVCQSETLLRYAITSGKDQYNQVFRCTDWKQKNQWIQEDVRLEKVGPKTYHVVTVCTNITAQKEAEQAIIEARTASDQANAAKTLFLANMSHEIRTPMTAILGYADLLADSTLAAEERDSFIRTIRRNGEHLMTVINDILDLSRIESGKMTVSHVACSPAELAFDVVRLMRPAAVKKGIQLDLRVDSDVPARVISDPTRLRQIMMNLVANAVKFTEKGSVDLRLHYRAQQMPEPQLSLEVIDTGVGISADDLPLLFSPFQQVDDSATRRFGGTGLGLAISRRLAQMLGGDISVRSEIGKGSCFNVLLSAPAAALGKTSIGTLATGGAADLSGVRVLLAEDSPDSRKLVCIHLRRMGCQIQAVENGKQAVERAKEAEASAAAFDVILMDMQMPIMDGYEAAWQLRSEGYDKPIIALTAHAMEGDRERCLDAGCSDYAVKPINIQQLSRMIRTHADRAGDVVR